jgi:hypothetical protein
MKQFFSLKRLNKEWTVWPVAVNASTETIGCLAECLAFQARLGQTTFNMTDCDIVMIEEKPHTSSPAKTFLREKQRKCRLCGFITEVTNH